MPVIAVINRKGGSGKSTLATHLAAYCAVTGKRVMLGDVDRQQSAQTWLKRRGSQKLPGQAAIQGWSLDPKNVLRAPAGVTHVVLDTPGGMRGFELARIVMSADAILMPVCNSVFDRESAAECFAELQSLPRVASGRCKVAAIGMRLDARTKADAVLAEWARKLELPFVGVLRETQAYVRCIENGLTLFDLPRNQVQGDLAQWKPIVAWLDDALRAPEAAPPQKNAAPQPAPAAAPVTKMQPTVSAEPPARPVPAQLLASAAANAAGHAAERVVPKVQPRVERASEGDLSQASTLASIGELARALKAAEPPHAAATHSRSPRTPGCDASTDVPVAPLRPTRPIVPQSGRSPPAHRASAAASSSAGAATHPHPAGAHGAALPREAAPSKAAGPDQTTHTSGTPGTLSPSQAARPRPNPTRAEPARAALGARLGQLLDTLPLPRFLQRNS